jgi:hypothetical protein
MIGETLLGLALTTYTVGKFLGIRKKIAEASNGDGLKAVAANALARALGSHGAGRGGRPTPKS